MAYTLVLLPGDGTGPEVMREAVKVLKAVQDSFGVSFDTFPFPAGGQYYMDTGAEWPDGAFESCKAADAILLGAVGLPDVSLPNRALDAAKGSSVGWNAPRDVRGQVERDGGMQAFPADLRRGRIGLFRSPSGLRIHRRVPAMAPPFAGGLRRRRHVERLRGHCDRPRRGPPRRDGHGRRGKHRRRARDVRADSRELSQACGQGRGESDRHDPRDADDARLARPKEEGRSLAGGRDRGRDGRRAPPGRGKGSHVRSRRQSPLQRSWVRDCRGHPEDRETERLGYRSRHSYSPHAAARPTAVERTRSPPSTARLAGPPSPRAPWTSRAA